MTEHNVPDNLRYTSDHEWVTEPDDDGVVTIGITAHAVSELGDIVYLELPGVGDSLGSGDACGEIESTKAVSEIYAPLPGEVVEVNPALEVTPEIVGDGPYGDGWLLKIRVADDAGDVELLDAAGYLALISG